ncbi:MAG TPA: ligase-associated DNA damage response exonuclease [Casimicrobiaceae bacterium]|nr:ligase-associated DNA damage response exonuclease [Casimicrobiaceae bacterium]
MTTLLSLTAAGLYCDAGGFHIDPWQSTERALITHAHADHARGGSAAYLGAAEGAPLLAARLPPDATIQTIGYGERLRIGDVDVSFHPAGHVLGSAQIRIARGDEVVVVSGDYKLAPDATCTPFEPVRCTTFVTESTFGLPIYRWSRPDDVFDDMLDWWRENQQARVASVVFAYALGKAQRIAAGLAARRTLPGPLYCHGAVARISDSYRAAGVALPDIEPVATAAADTDWTHALVLAPPSAQGSIWMRRFEPCRTAFASGWMAIRGTRRRANVDRGFVLSDHADWSALNTAVDESGADEIWVTHGYRDEFVRWLNESRSGRHAIGLATQFEGDTGQEPIDG